MTSKNLATFKGGFFSILRTKKNLFWNVNSQNRFFLFIQSILVYHQKALARTIPAIAPIAIPIPNPLPPQPQ